MNHLLKYTNFSEITSDQIKCRPTCTYPKYHANSIIVPWLKYVILSDLKRQYFFETRKFLQPSRVHSDSFVYCITDNVSTYVKISSYSSKIGDCPNDCMQSSN